MLPVMSQHKWQRLSSHHNKLTVMNAIMLQFVGYTTNTLTYSNCHRDLDILQSSTWEEPLRLQRWQKWREGNFSMSWHLPSLMEGRKTTEEIDLEGQTNYLIHTRRSFLSLGTLMLDSLHIPSCVHPQKVYQRLPVSANIRCNGKDNILQFNSCIWYKFTKHNHTVLHNKHSLRPTGMQMTHSKGYSSHDATVIDVFISLMYTRPTMELSFSNQWHIHIVHMYYFYNQSVSS